MKGIGWLMGVAGALLVLATPLLMVLLAEMVNRPVLPGSLPPYTVTRADTVRSFLLLGLTGLVGGLTLANGVYVVRHLRQSRWLSGLLLLGFGLLVLVMATGSAWLERVGL